MFTNMAGTVYNAILTQYYSQDSTGTKTFIGNDVQRAGSYLDTSNVPGAINDSTVNSEITSVMAANGWTNSPDTQFAVFPQSGATYTGSGFCAFHSVTMSGGYIYDMQPYLSDPNFPSSAACLAQYGNGSFTVAMNTVLSHEYAESATDPQANGNGWVQAGTLVEIGDMCASSVGVSGAVTGASVQMLWDNISDRCVTYAASSYVTAVQSNGPTVYYRLGENFAGTLITQATNSAFSSVNPSNNATYSSSVTQGNAGGIYGDPDTAAGFPNSSASVTSSGSGLPAGASARTVEAWFQTSANAASQSILAYGSQSNTNYFMMSLESTGTDIHIAGWSDNVDFLTSPSLADGLWHYIAVTYNGTTVITVNLDGQFLSQGNLAAPLNTTVPGAGLSIGYASDGTFSGNLDDVAIYPTALTQAQLTAHFRSRGGWVPQQPQTAPFGRDDAAAAYFTPNSTVVMFGGSCFNNACPVSVFNETWTWNGQNWQLQHPGNVPQARFGAAMAYDAATNTAIMFGGGTGQLKNGQPVYLGDTWSWDGTNWTQVATRGPSARADVVMQYDAATSNVVLFGGFSGSTAFGDTWVWSSGKWTQLHPMQSPSCRVGASSAYDASRAQVVLFSGGTSSSCASPWPYSPETWTWNGSTWTKQTPLTSPPGRGNAAMAYDSSTGTSILFSADVILTPTAYVYDNDTWVWDGATWTKQTLLTAPPGRTKASAAYVGSTRTFLVFGGQPYSGPDYNDTWTY